MRKNIYIFLFLMLISIIFYNGCGSDHVDVMPNLSSANLNVNVEWPVRQLNNTSARTAPPAYLNISTIEILLIDLDEYAAMEADSTSEIESFNIGKDMNSRYYEFDVKEGSEYRDGTEITDIPAGSYAFFFMPEDINGEYPFYYFQKVLIEDGKTTNVNISYEDWTIDVPVGASASPTISQRTANSLTLDWYDNGTNDSYAIYLDGSLYTDYDASLDTSEGYLYLEITGLDNGTDYSIHFETIKDSSTLEQFDITENTKFFVDTNLESAIITALNSVLPAESQITSEVQLTADLLANSSFTSFSYTPTNSSPVRTSAPRKALGDPLSNLTGLEFCQSISALSIPGNSVADITPISSLTELLYLDISSNSISDLTPITALTKLVNLDLSSNSITTIPALTNLTSLTALDLQGNQVNDITNLGALTSITQLNLSGNLVSDLSPLSTLTSLQALDISGNQVTDVSAIASLPSLTSVAANGNPPTLDLSALSTAGVTLDVASEPQIVDVTTNGNRDTIEVSFGVKYFSDSSVYIKFILEDSSEIEYPAPYVQTPITSTTGTKTIFINTQSIAEFSEQYVQNIKVSVTPKNSYPDETYSGISASFSLDNTPHPPQITNVSHSETGTYCNISYSLDDEVDSTANVNVFIRADGTNYELYNTNYLTGDIGSLSTGSTYNLSLDLAPYYRGTNETVSIALVGTDSNGYESTSEVSFSYNAFDMILLSTSELFNAFDIKARYSSSGDLCLVYMNDLGEIVFNKYYSSTLDNAGSTELSASISTVLNPSEMTVHDFVMVGDNPVIAASDGSNFPINIYYSNDGGASFSTYGINNDIVPYHNNTTQTIYENVVMTSDENYAYIGLSIHDSELVNDDYPDFVIARFNGSSIDTFEVALQNDNSYTFGTQSSPMNLLKTSSGDFYFDTTSSYSGELYQFVATNGDWANKEERYIAPYVTYEEFISFDAGTTVYTVYIEQASGLLMNIFENATSLESIDLSLNNPVSYVPAMGLTKIYSSGGISSLYPGALVKQEATYDEIHFLCKDMDGASTSDHFLLTNFDILSEGAYYNGKMCAITYDINAGKYYLLREK